MSARLDLPPEHFAPAECRAWLRSQLAGEEQNFCDEVALVASELVTNAVLYAKTPIGVELDDLGAAVVLQVSDGSSTMPSRGDCDAGCASGRGLGIVERIAGSWTAAALPDDSGKVVSCRIERCRPATPGARRRGAGAASGWIAAWRPAPGS